MWFDTRAKLAEILGEAPGGSATTARQAPAARPVSRMSQVSQPLEAGKPALHVSNVATFGAPVPAVPTENRDGAAEPLALDSFEERAAIREHDGGQARAEAEAAALAEVATAAGMAPEALQALWAAHPDARAYLAKLKCDGPLTYGAAASLLGWGATRAWQAEARLRAAGLVTMGGHGAAVPTGSGKE